jgi:RNA recognition motif-containing protein
MTKRQRELDQKDRVKQRESRRAERKQRSADRAASGQVGPEMGEPMPPIGDFTPEDHRDRAPLAPSRPQRAAARLYVGNLAYETTGEALRELFGELGEVADVHLVTDRDTGRPRGFAFVTMGPQVDAAMVIREINDRVVDGRNLRVREAEERQRPSGGGGGGRGRY